MFSWSGNFTTLLEKATSPQLLEPDWMVIMELCDSIRSGETEGKAALAAVKKKLLSKNPNVTMLALHCLESMVKNCGHTVHKEIATPAFMREFWNMFRVHESETVREKCLELIQTWAHAFRNEPDYRAVNDFMRFIRTTEEVKFPQLKESDAMFAAQVPPEWEDSDCCHLCRTGFTTFIRKHHCRNCGQVFCGKCSGQSAALPKLGIEKKVRVCDTCFTESPESPTHSSPVLKANPSAGTLKVSKRSPTSEQNKDLEAKAKEAQLREEEELQLAIALSQSEAEYNNTGKRPVMSERDDRRETEDRGKAPSVASSVSYPTEYAEANAPTRSECGSTTGSTESELNHYFDRKYWEERSNRVGDVGEAPKIVSNGMSGPIPSTIGDIEQFEQGLEKSLDTFVNRLRSNEMRGRPIANDTYVQSLFMQISSFHARLLQCVQETDDQRAYYESLQDKIQQIRDARAALDSLREDHREEERHRLEEAERVRQLQMAHKLEIMRQRKHEYLQYQHQMAMMKMQEQELQYRNAVTPMMPPMGIPPTQLPGQPPVYAPSAQYQQPGVPNMIPGAVPPAQNPQFEQMPPQYQTPMSPPHNGTAPQMAPQAPHYYPPHMGNMGQPGHLPQMGPNLQQIGPNHMPHLAGQNNLPQHQVQNSLPQHQGQGHLPHHEMVRPAFEPYNVSQMMATLPQPPSTPLPQPCAPPQTPTPNQQELNLPSVPTHQPAPPVIPEAQLISFD